MSFGNKLPRVSIRVLLLGANALTLLTPVFLFFGMRAYDVVLMRDTEEKLAAEAVVIGEVFREALSREGQEAGSIAPPGQESTVAPWEPQLGLRSHVGEPLAAPPMSNVPASPRSLAAGAVVQPILRRARTFNLSGARVLDVHGTVLASSDGRDVGASLTNAPEVRAAIAGRYGVATRRREQLGPAPTLGSLSRQGRVHVFVAVPIFSQGQVVGVVRMARTSVTTLEHLWKNRRGFLAFVALCAVCMIVLSLGTYRAVVGPVRAVTRKALAVAQGQDPQSVEAPAWSPSEVEELSRALENMKEQLRARADYVAEFAANATHELRTPLTAIGGATELLLENGAQMTEAQRERFLQNIQSDVARMGRLVGRLLTLARIDNPAGRTGAAATTEMPAFFEQLRHRYPTVHFDVEDAPSSVPYEEEHLRSAVINLLENACRHGQQVRLSATRTREATPRLQVEVEDDGPGIGEAHEHRIFERFYTTERDRGGNGLGLAIVKAVADSGGGRLSFRREPGRTIFTLVL